MNLQEYIGQPLSSVYKHLRANNHTEILMPGYPIPNDPSPTYIKISTVDGTANHDSVVKDVYLIRG